MNRRLRVILTHNLFLIKTMEVILSMDSQNAETTLNETGSGQKERIKPVLELREGNTTFLIGLHFSENTRETLGEKIKKLIRKDVQDGNF